MCGIVVGQHDGRPVSAKQLLWSVVEFAECMLVIIISVSLSINIVEHEHSWFTLVAYTISWSVCYCVCLKSVLWQNVSVDLDAVWGGECGQRGMGILDGGGDRLRGKGSFGIKFGASHYNQWGFCCIVV